MKKYLAIILAVAMIVTMNVVGMAATAANSEEEPGGEDSSSSSSSSESKDPEEPSSTDPKPSSDPASSEAETAGGSDTHEEKNSAAKAVTESNRAQQETAIAAIEAISAGDTVSSAVKVQEVVTAAGNTVQAVSAKLYGAGASLSLKSMATVADASVSLNVSLDNGAAEVLIPAGFTMPSTPGVVGFSIGYQQDPLYANLMTRQVKGDNAKTEVCKLGGGTLPTTATVSVKTKLTGPVNIYYWNEDTRKATLLATATAENGKVSFATQQMGNMIITTGTV